MAYESIDKLKIYMQKKIDAIVTGEQVAFNINAHQLLDELNEMERKAKSFERIVEFYPQKDEIPSDEFFDLMGYIIEGREVDGV